MQVKKDFFISYCWDDAEIVRPIAQDLIDKDIPLWLDVRQIADNDSPPKEIRDALEKSYTVLLMWSQRSQIARWCRDEMGAAIRLQKRIILCPLDGTPIPKLLKSPKIEIVDLKESNTLRATEKILEAVQQPIEETATIFQPRNIPYDPNQHFTGREKELRAIETKLNNQHGIATTVVAGMGGAGKTELVLEYAHRHLADYRLVWWIHSEGEVTLEIDYERLAHGLDLPEKNKKDRNVIIAAVKRWLDSHDGWLLIFDNAHELEKIREFLPQKSEGHIIITSRKSRRSSWKKIGAFLKLGVWQRVESVEFLLKRTGQQDEDAADAVAETMGDLPLALEQAGAYMEVTRINLAKYQKFFEEERRALPVRGELSTEYPDVVATTWEMAFREIRRDSETPLLLLNLCAFLAPDAVPLDKLGEKAKKVVEKFTIAGTKKVAFKNMLGLLLNYSLIRVDNEQLTVHRLVQDVTRDRMVDGEQSCWAEAAVALIANIFPSGKDLDPRDISSWPQCQTWLPHAYTTTRHAERHKVDWQSVSFLFHLMGIYLNSRSAYYDAEPLHRRSLKIRETQLGPRHLDVVKSLTNLAMSVLSQAKYKEAEKLCRRALKIVETWGEEKDLFETTIINTLAMALQAQAKYREAEPLHHRALKIREKHLGKNHPDVAQSLSNLGTLSTIQAKYSNAERFHRQALGIYEMQVGKDDPFVAKSLNNLAVALQAQGRYPEAEPLVRRALEIFEAQLGKDHLEIAGSLINLAVLLKEQDKYSDAEQLIRRALTIYEAQLGKDHPDAATGLHTLAVLFRAQGKYNEAESLHRRALKTREVRLGKKHPDVAKSLNNLALLLKEQGKHKECRTALRRALKIYEAKLGKDHPDVATFLNNLAAVLEALGKHSEAAPLYRRTVKIYEAQLGKSHPHVANSLNNLAASLQAQTKYREAEPLYRRAVEIYETSLGKDDPRTVGVQDNLNSLVDEMETRQGNYHSLEAYTLSSLALSFKDEGKNTEAEALYRQALAIKEAQLGKDHPDVAISLNNLAAVLGAQGKHSEAAPLLRRALGIYEVRFGKDHSDTRALRNNLAAILDQMQSPESK